MLDTHECYEHTYEIAFTVRTKHSTRNVTAEEVLLGLSRKLEWLEANPELLLGAKAVTHIEAEIVLE